MLPNSSDKALSCSEIRGLLNENGRLIKKNSAIHKILTTLEKNRIATFTKKGRAFYWYRSIS